MEKIHEIRFLTPALILTIPDSKLKEIEKRPKKEIPEHDPIPVPYNDKIYWFSRKEVEGSARITHWEEMRKRK